MSKTFSLEEANKALIFVEPILRDIKKTWHELQILKENVRTQSDIEVIKSHFKRIEHYLEELIQVGCICKDLELGLVDFPCLHDGNLVYLCWKMGDEKINHWHTVNGGYKNREEIDEEFIFIEKLKKKTNPSSSFAS